jgi:DNA-binding transcriptional LysR family regulator
MGVFVTLATAMIISQTSGADRIKITSSSGLPVVMLEAHHLTQTELVVVVPSAWPTDFAPSDWHALAARPWISPLMSCPFQNAVDAHLARHGLSCNHHVHLGDDRGRYELVKAELGLSLLERYACLTDAIVSPQIRADTLKSLGKSYGVNRRSQFKREDFCRYGH